MLRSFLVVAAAALAALHPAPSEAIPRMRCLQEARKFADIRLNNDLFTNCDADAATIFFRSFCKTDICEDLTAVRCRKRAFRSNVRAARLQFCTPTACTDFPNRLVQIVGAPNERPPYSAFTENRLIAGSVRYSPFNPEASSVLNSKHAFEKSFTLRYPVAPAGTKCKVTVGFEETFHSARRRRVFDLSVIGAETIAETDIDVFDEVGAFQPYFLEFETETDSIGRLAIKFGPSEIGKAFMSTLVIDCCDP